MTSLSKTHAHVILEFPADKRWLKGDFPYNLHGETETGLLPIEQSNDALYDLRFSLA